MTSNIIVFGGSGFVGSHLVKRLAACKSNFVISVDLLPPRETVDGVEYRIADVRDLSDFPSVKDVSIVFNLAAIHTTPGHETHEYYETNISGAVEVCKLAERVGAQTIVFTSSISVYGPSEDTKTEDSSPAPESAYGFSKLIAEKIHRSWRERVSERSLVIVRPAVVFGPGEGGNFTRLARLLKKGVFIYPGRKDTIKACVYVDDLLNQIDFALSHGSKDITFNAAYPDRYTLEQIVETFRQDHFKSARTFLVPKGLLLLLANVMKPLDLLGFGIHPDRVKKLIRSTDIRPGWLIDNGQERFGSLRGALQLWGKATGGRFN